MALRNNTFHYEDKQLSTRIPQEVKHPDTIIIKSDLSYGSQSITYLGTYTKQGYKPEQVVIKRYTNTTQEGCEQLLRERKALEASFPSEYIVRFVGYCQNPPIILMEYEKNGALDFILQNNNIDLTFNQLMIIANDIALGVLKLLEVNFVHRDIKTANILITEQFRAKLCDFDTARNKDFKPYETIPLAGTPFYLAPEHYLFSKFKLKNNGLPAADVFSFGMVLIDLFIKNNDTLLKEYINLSNRNMTKESLLENILNKSGCSKAPHHLQNDIKITINSFITEYIEHSNQNVNKMALLQQMLNEFDFSKVQPYSTDIKAAITSCISIDKIAVLKKILKESDFSRIPSHFNIKAIIESCIDENPENRPTMEMIQRKLQLIIHYDAGKEEFIKRFLITARKAYATNQAIAPKKTTENVTTKSGFIKETTAYLTYAFFSAPRAYGIASAVTDQTPKEKGPLPSLLDFF